MEIFIVCGRELLFFFFKECAVLPQMTASYQSVTGWCVVSHERQLKDRVGVKKESPRLDSRLAPIKMADDLIRL